jgi:DNA-binding transcriptional LysR family regulator
VLDWNDLRYFLAIHHAGTLAGAAGVLGINATTVGRRLAALEEEVGARLYDRTPAGYVLTAAGRDLLPHAERMEAAAFALERDVAGADQRLAGVVRLSTTEMLGTRFLAPHLGRFHERHPEIVIDLSCALRPVSLTRREADVVLRLSRPREPDVIARELASVHLSLYAARTYLDRRGRPEGGALVGHEVLLFADTAPFQLENDWLAGRIQGARVALRSDSVSSIYAATVAGVGIALLPRIVADGEPLLERLRFEGSPEPRRIWSGVHRDLARSPRVQAVLALLGEVVLEERRMG